MTDNEEVVMTPLQAPEGTTVLKVERVPRGQLDPRTVHYVAGGRYEGIIINRAANERPDNRPSHVRRKFTCYIGSKGRGEPMREQRQLRFWFRHGTSDWDPMTDRFLKELLNPHLFPRDYIGYTKRILELLQGFPTVTKMELEMRPARPEEEDQQYVVRRIRQKSQPPPPTTQEDYHTWHAPRRGGSRGEINSAVGGTLHKERARTPDRRGRGGPSQEDARSYAQRRGNVISQWSSVHQENRRLSTRSPSPGRSLSRPSSRQSQDSIIEAINSAGRRRYSIDSLDSADFMSPTETSSYRIYTSSPRCDRRDEPPTDDRPHSPNTSSYSTDSDLTTSLSEWLFPRLSIMSDPAITCKEEPPPRRRSIKVVKVGNPQTDTDKDADKPPAVHRSEITLSPSPSESKPPDKSVEVEVPIRRRSTAYLQLTPPTQRSNPPGYRKSDPTDYPRPELAFEISLEIEDPTESEPTGPYSTVNDPQISHFDTLNEDAPDDLQALDTNEIPDSDMNISSEMINCMEIPQESALEVMDDSVQETINDFPEQTMEDPVQSTADEPTLETIDKEVHHSPDVNDSLDEPSAGVSWRMHEEKREAQTYSLTSRSPSPARVILRRLPPSPVVSRVRSSPVTIRRAGGSSTAVPIVITNARPMSAPPPPKPPPEHPGLSRRGIQVLWVARRYRVLKLLEDAYPNSVTADELMRYYKIYAGRRRLMDVVSLATILQWLAGKGLVREVEQGRWMRLETTKSAGHKSWTHSTQIVTELPLLPRDEMPTVAIVTLLYAEKLAVDSMIDNGKTYVWRRPHDVGEGQVITLGNIGHIRVVSTKLPKPGEGESAMMAARNATTRVIGSFATVTRVLLVGVAGGIAHFTDDRHHVRRGDVIVAKPKQARSPMYIYCTGTERGVTGDYRFASRNWVTKDEILENLIQRFQARQRKDPDFAPWENNIDYGLDYLAGGDVQYSRPEVSTDRLVRLGPDGFVKEVQHPIIRRGSTRDMKPHRPVVHYDVIGGGEALLGDYNKRRTFAMLTGAKAIDPGYQPVLEAIEEAKKDSVAIIRGIADYSDGRSDSHWQPYASLAAAAFARALLLELPQDA